MPDTAAGASAGAGWMRRRGPELMLAALASAVFLGFLGSVDLWGKREQRASAEAIDTIDHAHWLVAQIQGRPRLEKPPLPRWTIASLMTLTGRRDEWMVRLPSALSALGMVALTYALGRRIGGRSVGLASGFALCSMGFFISELRQAGNDGPLAFFTTLALYAAWRRLNPELEPGDGAGQGMAAGSRNWNLVFHAALGLGFLCKGPIVLILVGLTVIPYLLLARRLVSGASLLWDWRGLALMTLLVLSWPVPVVLSDPNATRIWMLEMGQKAGTAGVAHSRWRAPLAADFPWMTLPWAVLALLAVALPFLPRGRAFRPKVWFPWWWSVGNLAMFSLWSVAKPNYFLPCLPGAALLVGLEWVRLSRTARAIGPLGAASRRVLQFHWVILLAAPIVAPVVVHQVLKRPEFTVAAFAFSLALAAGVVASAWAWRRGADGMAFAPLATAIGAGALIAYGAVAPAENGRRSHRELATTLEAILPPGERNVMFFHELDEGLWFYLRGHELLPVPGSQPEYNDSFRLAEDLRQNRLEWDWRKRVEAQQATLVDWIRAPRHESTYVLIRDKDYALFAPALEGLVEMVHREEGLSRNNLILLRLAHAGTSSIAVEDSQAAARR